MTEHTLQKGNRLRQNRLNTYYKYALALPKANSVFIAA
jgi:hypothetical protein